MVGKGSGVESGVDDLFAVGGEVDILGTSSGDGEDGVGEGGEELLFAEGDLVFPSLEGEGELAGDVDVISSTGAGVDVEQVTGGGVGNEDLGRVRGPEEISGLKVVARWVFGNLAGGLAEGEGVVGKLQDVETVFEASRGRGDGEGDFLAVGGGVEIAGPREGEGREGGDGAEELGVGGGNDLGFDGEGLFPGVVAVFFELDGVGAGVLVQGDVGDFVDKDAIDVDAGALG